MDDAMRRTAAPALTLVVPLLCIAFVAEPPARPQTAAVLQRVTLTATATGTPPTLTPSPSATATDTPTITNTPTNTQAPITLPLIVQPPNSPTPTNTTIPTNTPIPTLVPLPPGTVVNGSFENDDDGWDATADYVIGSTFPSGARAHGGRYAAWLGGEPGGSSISQGIRIGSQQRFLVYWYWIASADGCSGFDPDYAEVTLNDGDDTIDDDEIVDSFRLCSRNNTDGWERRVVDIGRFANQERELAFTALLDDSLNSNWFIDDVLLQTSR